MRTAAAAAGGAAWVVGTWLVEQQSGLRDYCEHSDANHTLILTIPALLCAFMVATGSEACLEV